MYQYMALVLIGTEGWKIEHSLSLASLILVVVGGVFGLVQWRDANRTKKAELVYKILTEIQTDRQLHETMYIIDYGPEWYDDKFHESGKEFLIDRLFFYVSYVCYLKEIKRIGENEFDPFRYIVVRICRSESSIEYLWNLYHFSKANKTTCSFNWLIEYAKSAKLLDESFFEKDNKSFTKRLNF